MGEVDRFQCIVAIELTVIGSDIAVCSDIPSEAFSAHIEFLEAGELANTGKDGNTCMLVGGHASDAGKEYILESILIGFIRF